MRKLGRCCGFLLWALACEFGVGSGDDEGDFAFDGLAVEEGDEVGEVAAVDALVGFGEFDTDGGLAVAEGVEGGFERGGDAEGGLEADEGVGEALLLLEEAAERAGFAGGEAFEGEAGGGEAGAEEGEIDGGCAGDDVEGGVSLGGAADEAVAGVADAGVAAV